MGLRVNGELIDEDVYARFHKRRFEQTLDLVGRFGGGDLVEVGGHPWVMTGRLAAAPGVNLLATVSAEEVTAWPEELVIQRNIYDIQTDEGSSRQFPNYSANVERTLFPIGLKADMIVACEIIEHLARSPHIMLLNINSWLKMGGYVVMTTPNGSQFENPFRVKPKMPSYRPSVYSRHNYVYTMEILTDLVTACGFEIVVADFWSPYTRSGATNLYRSFYNFGPLYLKQKFAQTLCVVARKTEDRTTACRLPRCYANEAGWERVDL
ncbi:MAG: methyltransferase domain-containing protein [Caulobacter sp.]|nr:methyltransferase domain-containing protein [Caulobacter sp.]